VVYCRPFLSTISSCYWATSLCLRNWFFLGNNIYVAISNAITAVVWCWMLWLSNKHTTDRLVRYTDLDLCRALVVIVAGLKSKWKAQTAFYLTEDLKHNMISVEKVIECHLIMHVITIDTTLMIYRLFGCHLVASHLKTWFCWPKQITNLCLLMDVCHIIKLLCNGLEALRVINSYLLCYQMAWYTDSSWHL
jgi:hypothetical protein